MVRTCQHHDYYTQSEQVQCKLHGVVEVYACSSCKEFLLKPQPKRDKTKPSEQAAVGQVGFKCVHLGSKRTCCQDLFLCKKFPGESCNPSGTIPNVMQCRSCTEFIPVDKTELWTPSRRNETGNPRVGFISASYMRIGGTETFHRSLLPRLKSRVDIAGFVSTAFFGGDETLLQVPYATNTEAARKLARHCDTVVVWGLDNLNHFLHGDRPQVIAVHHSDWSSEWSNRQILSQLDLIDEVICVNRDTAKNLATCGKPVHYIPNAIDPDRVKPSGRQSELRSEHRIADDAKIVLFGHRLSAEKRPLLAVQIAQHLPANWVMVIAGDGAERAMVESAACDRVRIVGACESLADWLAVSNCFLSLSTFEGFGLAIGEAMAAGIPTVSTPAGIAPELATTLPVDSTLEEWARAIVNAKVIAPASSVLERFSVQRMVDAWAKILKSQIP